MFAMFPPREFYRLFAFTVHSGESRTDEVGVFNINVVQLHPTLEPPGDMSQKQVRTPCC